VRPVFGAVFLVDKCPSKVIVEWIYYTFSFTRCGVAVKLDSRPPGLLGGQPGPLGINQTLYIHIISQVEVMSRYCLNFCIWVVEQVCGAARRILEDEKQGQRQPDQHNYQSVQHILEMKSPIRS